MPQIESPFFHTLPQSEDIVRLLEDRGMVGIKDVRLFPYSSANPTFLVHLGNPYRGRRLLVLRGAAQNVLFGPSTDAPCLKGEVEFYALLRSAGLVVPEVYWDGSRVSVKARDRRTGEQTQMRLYAMSYVQGAALDRAILNASADSRIAKLDGAARTLAKMHSIKGNYYGLLTGDGPTPSDASELLEYLGKIIRFKLKLTEEMGDVALAETGRHFIDAELEPILDRIVDSQYDSTPALGIYDSGGGNLLCHGRTIGIIDAATGGYIVPIMDFCGLFFSLSMVFCEKIDGKIILDYFLESYRFYGGELPNTEVLSSAMRLFLINDILGSYLYFSSHFAAEKRRKSPLLRDIVCSLISQREPSLTKLIRALDPS